MDSPQSITRTRERVQERYDGTLDDHIAPDAREDADVGFDTAWRMWLDATTHLQGIGFAPRALCDAVNGVAEERTKALSESGERTGTPTA